MQKKLYILVTVCLLRIGATAAAYSLRTLPPHDPGQDRALPSLDEKCGQAQKLLLPLGAGTVHRSFRRILQS